MGIFSSKVLKIEPEDVVVLIVGNQGTGKTSFINTAAERQHLTVDHKLSGGTKKISAIRCTINQGEDRRQIVLVDTVPSNSEYFNHKMREWMKQQNSPKISAIIYLESILIKREDSTNRPEKHVESLMTMYRGAQPKLVTTMWRIPIKNQTEAKYKIVWTDLEDGWKKKYPDNDIADYKIESPEAVWKIVENVLSV